MDDFWRVAWDSGQVTRETLAAMDQVTLKAQKPGCVLHWHGWLAVVSRKCSVHMLQRMAANYRQLLRAFHTTHLAPWIKFSC